jgi:hypothetical protein
VIEVVPKLRILSLGAGVQSTALLLMGLRGEFGPPPDAAIFADTQAEPAHVYAHLDWLEREVAPFPIHRVTAGNLFTQIGKQRPTGEWRHMPIPAFIAGEDGGAALANRSCTRDFKIDPIIKKVRELAGYTRKRAPSTPIVEQWIGISLDEVSRMKPSRHPWIEHRWPLVEERMSRGTCLQWLKRHGYPEPAKSSCTFCPYHNDAAWIDLRDNDPAGWQQALDVDARIRNLWQGRVPSGIYLHRSLKPLAEAEFRDDGQHDLFTDECEGMCGV